MGVTLDPWKRHGSMLEVAGRLITIEGIDGAGKTTLARALVQRLSAAGHTAEFVREPGGVELAEILRALVTDPDTFITARAEALLYAAARAQLVEELLEPRLAAGTLLILDRFLDSSLAYQGAGRGLGLDPVRLINDFAVGTLRPDRTLLLRLPVQLARARKRGEASPPDRLEREDERFFTAIAAAYEQLAAAEPERIHTIDATQPADHVVDQALTVLADLLAPSD
jgi:dTMP kinase